MEKTNNFVQQRVFNDPIHGFISIPGDLIFGLIQHPYFQRLRRISQLGLTNIVYSGALHTRFQHAIGAMHLMQQAIDILRAKGHAISQEEALGVNVAILLHDIGHGPYSHTLEHSLVKGVSHEDVSSLIMNKLNAEFNGALDLAISIFRNQYHKKYLHQLVASQLDMDRLDYLERDSFFCGVKEGVVNSQRIIKMLNIIDGELVVDAKGIYSVEKFLIARRLMYWQVYLHKTVISAEYLLIMVLKRARYLIREGQQLFATPSLQYFLKNDITRADFLKNADPLANFTELDDFDIMASIKAWCKHTDVVLATLCKRIVNRHLLKIKLRATPFSEAEIAEEKQKAMQMLGLNAAEVEYFVFTDDITNSAYKPDNDKIRVLYKDGSTADVAVAADLLNISTLSVEVKKYFMCYPQTA